jgi:hypothetical protein
MEGELSKSLEVAGPSSYYITVNVSWLLGILHNSNDSKQKLDGYL